MATIADLLWELLGAGDPMPHDGRNLPPDEVLRWVCPQCGTTIDEGARARPPCTVDWRKPLHASRYRAAAARIGIDPDLDVDTLRRRLLYGERVEELDRMTYDECGRLVHGESWNRRISDHMASADAIDIANNWLTRPEDAE